MRLAPEQAKPLLYGFGHLVGSFGYPDDAHASDSAELAADVFSDLGLSAREADIIETIAEHVAGNYDYTGAAEDIRGKVERGEI